MTLCAAFLKAHEDCPIDIVFAVLDDRIMEVGQRMMREHK